MSVRVETKYIDKIVTPEMLAGIQPQITAAADTLRKGTGAGSGFRGWIDLPANYDRAEFSRIKAAADRIRKAVISLLQSV